MRSKLPINLGALLHQRKVEGDRIEFKAGWNPDPILRTLCAFANDFENQGGGYVVIWQDCDESGVAVFPQVGLLENQLDGIQRELLRFCNLIQPPYFPMLSVEKFKVRILGTEHHIIPDIILFLNGLPVVVIECKSPRVKDATAEAIDQLMRYSEKYFYRWAGPSNWR